MCLVEACEPLGGLMGAAGAQEKERTKLLFLCHYPQILDIGDGEWEWGGDMLKGATIPNSQSSAREGGEMSSNPLPQTPAQSPHSGLNSYGLKSLVSHGRTQFPQWAIVHSLSFCRLPMV